MTTETANDTGQPPTRKQVRASIDDADVAFRTCWETLASLKKVKVDGPALLDFQPTLASALYRLDDIYRQLVHHSGVLVSKKASFSPETFRRRMRALDQDLKGLRTAICVGRNLGDAFVWIFYQYDQPSLELHFRNPPNPHTPPGIGGRGELEFIRQFRLPGFLILYHGITTFLRIGDVSFFNPATGRISAIGELKTTLLKPGELMVSMHSIHREKIPFANANARPVQREIPNGRHSQPPTAGSQTKKKQFEATLERQTKKMAEALRRTEPSRKADLRSAYQTDDVAMFANQLSARGLGFQQIGKGGVLVGCCPYRGRSLSSRIYSKVSEASVLKRFARLRGQVATICDPSSTDNSIFYSELDPGVCRGIAPLFWFPCDIDFLEKTYFKRAVVGTIYNPVHLLRALQARGYEVRVGYPKDGTPRFEIRKPISEAVAGIEGFDSYLRLIQHRFMREEKIIHARDTVVMQSLELTAGRPGRIDLNFAHFF